MTDPAVRARFEDYLARLTQVARDRDDVIGLVGMGSTAELWRVDEWSDHDFAWMVQPGAQDRYRYDLSWLPDAERIALSVVEHHGGVKVIYDDGHVLEFGMATLESLQHGSATPWRSTSTRAESRMPWPAWSPSPCPRAPSISRARCA